MRVRKVTKVRTPGAPPLDTPVRRQSSDELETPESKRKRKKERKEEKERKRKRKMKMKVGRPSKSPKGRRARISLRANYTEADIVEAVRLVRMEGMGKKSASLFLNERKTNVVPKTTLINRLDRDSPLKKPKLGRPTVLRGEAEEGLVKCLEIAGDFNYPMSKRQLQKLVQAHVTEHQLLVPESWTNGMPGIGWVKKFRKRWAHRVKTRRPTNIKRSRAKVSPNIVRKWFADHAAELQGVPASHIFNYDETGFRDDPGAEVAFFGRECRYYEKVQNHSKAQYSVEFCVSADGTMLPPMTVYKSNTTSVYTSWCDAAPQSYVFAATKSGWFDMQAFEKWFRKVRTLFLI